MQPQDRLAFSGIEDRPPLKLPRLPEPKVMALLPLPEVKLPRLPRPLLEAVAPPPRPLKFMPPGYGSWSFHAGVRYMDFVDDNLIATQNESDTVQVYCGITAFF